MKKNSGNKKQKRNDTSPGNLKLLAYSVKDFCKAVGISSRMFYALVSNGDGPTITRIGRRTLVTTAAAEKWLLAHQTKKAA